MGRTGCHPELEPLFERGLVFGGFNAEREQRQAGLEQPVLLPFQLTELGASVTM
ncbi:hypothetical protein MYX65_00870 [Acidobacteria bacterium AH-259-L09]|nr:hypothetical protein [Acidobacteria bacterium AH-259-L09]